MRLGEMEVHAMTAHGMGGVVQESLQTNGDGESLWICPRCSTYVRDASARCPRHPYDAPVEARHAYTFKLLRHWLGAMGLGTHVDVTDAVARACPPPESADIRTEVDLDVGAKNTDVETDVYQSSADASTDHLHTGGMAL